MARIKYTGTTDSTGVASTTVTGSGGGRLKFISRNGGLWSNSYEIEDCSFKDMGTSSDHNDNWSNSGGNVTVVRTDTETTLTRTASTNGFYQARIDNFNYVIDFDYIQNGTSLMTSLRTGSTVIKWINYSEFNLSANVWYHITLTINGTSLVITIDGVSKSYTMPSTPNWFSMRLTENEEIRYKNFKMYPVFTAPKHYTPIALSSSASIIQTGESATLTAELTNVLGEKVASKSVNFIEKVEHLYENTSEVSQVYNSGQNVTVLSPSISRTDLGTSWTLSFDLKTDCESRVFIGNSASAIPTNPQYSIFMGRDTSNVISYGFRTTTTTVTASNVASTSYHSCKIVFNNGTITYYVDDTQVGTKTVSFYGNYDNYVVGIVAWGTGTLYAKNIILDNENGGNILIGTDTSNSQGIATCNNSITGTGKGERQFIASNSSISSETYGVIDALFVDDGTSDNSSNWSLNGVSYSQSDDAVTLNNATGSTKWCTPKVNGSNISLDTTKDYCIEIDIKNVNCTDLRIILQNTSVSLHSYVSTSDFTHIKIYSSKSEGKTYYIIDGTTRRVNSGTVNTDMSLRIPDSEGYMFKNFCIYPI